jgi:hypothetical protein
MKKEWIMRSYRLFAALAALMLLAVLPAHVSAQTRTHTASAATLISTYYSHMNVDFQSGDFSDLSQFYAPDAVLTQSNPAGVTKVYKGLAAITAFYKATYAKLPSLHFGLTAERSLGPNILLRYEHGSTPTMANGPRCAHLFMVQNGLIQTDDWVTYFAGK